MSRRNILYALPLALSLISVACGSSPERQWESRGSYTSKSGAVVQVAKEVGRGGLYRGTWKGSEGHEIELECNYGDPLYLRRDGQPVLTARFGYTGDEVAPRVRLNGYLDAYQQDRVVHVVADGFNTFETQDLAMDACKSVESQVLKFENEQAQTLEQKTAEDRAADTKSLGQ